ncbi:MAG: hypothetical protein ABSD08_07820 [Xanthobacteraceae bacterium]|jgi:hypothetical protein
MNPFLGPLDDNGRIPAYQQTRVSAFLMSAHGALARQLAVAQPGRLQDGLQVEMHAECCRQIEFLSMLARATSWVPDPMLPFLFWQWEAAWWPRPVDCVADRTQARMIDLAAFNHALHAVIRPAALLPETIDPMDPFVQAMRHIEFESGRLMQAQIIFLKSPQFVSVRDEVAAAVERRHEQVRELLASMLEGIEVDTSGRHLIPTAYHLSAKAAFDAAVAAAVAKSSEAAKQS